MSSAKTSAATWPQGSSETILSGSVHCGWGPIGTAGWVSARSGLWVASSVPAATARALKKP